MQLNNCWFLQRCSKKYIEKIRKKKQAMCCGFLRTAAYNMHFMMQFQKTAAHSLSFYQKPAYVTYSILFHYLPPLFLQNPRNSYSSSSSSFKPMKIVYLLEKFAWFHLLLLSLLVHFFFFHHWLSPLFILSLNDPRKNLLQTYEKICFFFILSSFLLSFFFFFFICFENPGKNQGISVSWCFWFFFSFFFEKWLYLLILFFFFNFIGGHIVAILHLDTQCNFFWYQFSLFFKFLGLNDVVYYL